MTWKIIIAKTSWSLVVQWVKDLALSLLWLLILLWCGFNTWLRNFCMVQVQPKKKKDSESLNKRKGEEGGKGERGDRGGDKVNLWVTYFHQAQLNGTSIFWEQSKREALCWAWRHKEKDLDTLRHKDTPCSSPHNLLGETVKFTGPCHAPYVCSSSEGDGTQPPSNKN